MSDEAPSTDTSSSSELKAGHAPATKVGGMRVAAPRPRHTSHGEEKTTESGKEASGDTATEDDAKETTNEGAEDQQETSAVANRTAGQMVGGTFVPVQKAFPTEAVKNIHDKPGTHPKHETRSHSKQDDIRLINQPGKK